MNTIIPYSLLAAALLMCLGAPSYADTAPKPAALTLAGSSARTDVNARDSRRKTRQQTKDDAEADQLRAKYPDADLAVREVQTALYDCTILKQTEIGSIGAENGAPSLNLNRMYCGKNIVFLGDMSSYIGVAGSTDLQSRIINVASMDYDASQQRNPPLAALGVVALNESGIVKSDAAKSGWINWVSSLSFNDSGRSRTLKLSDITFWVNRGGKNWLSFSVGNVREANSDGSLGAEVPVVVSLDHKGPNGSVTIRVADKYTFHASIKDDTTLVFIADGPAPPSQPAPTSPGSLAGGDANPRGSDGKTQAEITAWESARKIGTPTAFQEFYQQYPHSPLIKVVTGTLRGRYWFRSMDSKQNRRGVLVTVEGMNILANVSLAEAKKLNIIASDPATPGLEASAKGQTFNYLYSEVTEGGCIVDNELISPKDSVNSIIVLSGDGTRLLSWDVSKAQTAAKPDSHPTFIRSYETTPPFNDPDSVNP